LKISRAAASFKQRNKSDREGSQIGTKATRQCFSLTEIKRNPGRSVVKKIVLASACILALALPAAAQNAQPSDGASSQGNVGPGAPQGTMKNETGTMNKGTTGASLTRRRRQHFRREHCSRHP